MNDNNNDNNKKIIKFILKDMLLPLLIISIFWLIYLFATHINTIVAFLCL